MNSTLLYVCGRRVMLHRLDCPHQVLPGATSQGRPVKPTVFVKATPSELAKLPPCSDCLRKEAS